MSPYTYILPQINADKDHIQVGAVDLLIELEIKNGHKALDISAATTKNIILEKPDDTIITAPGTFTTDGKDGLLYYLTVAGDLDQAGIYNAQAYLVLPGFTGYSTPVSFQVYANIPLPNN